MMRSIVLTKDMAQTGPAPAKTMTSTAGIEPEMKQKHRIELDTDDYNVEFEMQDHSVELDIEKDGIERKIGGPHIDNGFEDHDGLNEFDVYNDEDKLLRLRRR